MALIFEFHEALFIPFFKRSFFLSAIFCLLLSALFLIELYTNLKKMSQ